jgi:DNA-binding MarR family transcriptional regulator
MLDPDRYLCVTRSEGGSMPGSPLVADDLRAASRIGTGLGRLIRLIERAAAARGEDAVARGEDLDRPSFMLLHTLVCAGPSRVTALAAAVHSDPSTVSRQAAHLVGMGLVERRADPGDGRASLLAITDAGAALLERARQRRDDRIAAIIRSWQPAERAQFADLIDRFTAGYEANWRCADRLDPSRS